MNKTFIFNIINGIYKRANTLFVNPYKKVGFNWLKVRKVKNLQDKKLQSINFYNKELYFWSRDEFLHSLREIFIEEIYKLEPAKKPFIIDCGANIGLSVIYLNRLFPDANIIAFEPDDKNFEILTKNVNSFGLKNVELRKEAVWCENTYLNFVSDGSLMSKIEKEATGGNSINVKATRLKDLLTKETFFLKIDIEGAEYVVLKDIENNLQLVQNLFLEYHGKFSQNAELNEILKIITANGFYYYIRHAIDKHSTPFERTPSIDYDVQLNIFCFKK